MVFERAEAQYKIHIAAGRIEAVSFAGQHHQPTVPLGTFQDQMETVTAFRRKSTAGHPTSALW